MNPIDDRIDAHLRLFAAAAPAEVEQARERARLRLLEAASALPSRGVFMANVSWRRAFTIGIAAAAVFLLTLQGPETWRAVMMHRPPVARAVGWDVFRASGAPVGQGEAIAQGERVHSRNTNAPLVMADGSRIEMRANSELWLEPADDGMAIRLENGSIIVNAAKQHGHLYVTTKDVTVSVVGTVFLVHADTDGSTVGVIEGEVHVREGKTETSLRPGQQVSTNPKIVARPLTEAIAWSRNLEAHLAILANFEKGMAATADPLAPLLERRRAQSGLAQGGAGAGPEFEEATIRPCDPANVPEPPAGARGGGVNSFQMTPGRTHALCLTLATLIRTAYGYSPGRLSFGNGGRARGLAFDNVYGLGVEDGLRVRGGPDWVRTARYTIDAVAADSADAATMSGPMLRALLEKRFQLKAHVESEQIPAFDLVVGAGGVKMKEGTCTRDTAASALGSRIDMVPGNLETIRRGDGGGACGSNGAWMHGPNIVFVGAGAGLPNLAGLLGAPVTDKTGIPATTRFNYALEFLPDPTMTGPLRSALSGPPNGPDAQVASDPASVMPAPDLFTALEQQLGLRLEPSKAPREFIVVDSVQRPSAN